MLAGEGLELFDIVLRMSGLQSFDEEWANAVVLEEVVALQAARSGETNT